MSEDVLCSWRTWNVTKKEYLHYLQVPACAAYCSSAVAGLLFICYRMCYLELEKPWTLLVEGSRVVFACVRACVSKYL